MAISDDLIIIAPELATVGSSVRDFFITMATAQVGSVFGALQDTAITYLAAHLLTMKLRQGEPGQIASKGEGSLNVSYATNNARDDSFGQTTYGQEFLRLRRMKVVGATLAF